MNVCMYFHVKMHRANVYILPLKYTKNLKPYTFDLLQLSDSFCYELLYKVGFLHTKQT